MEVVVVLVVEVLVEEVVFVISVVLVEDDVISVELDMEYGS